MNKRLHQQMSMRELKDETIFREHAYRLLNDMSFEELGKLFKFKKTDPFTEESIQLMRNPETPSHIRERLLHLNVEGMLEFETSIRIQ